MTQIELRNKYFNMMAELKNEINACKDEIEKARLKGKLSIAESIVLDIDDAPAVNIR